MTARIDVVLGVDPGLTRCGWGVVHRISGRLEAVDHGVIATSPESDVGSRLAVLADAFEAVVGEYRPECAAVERVLFNANVRTAMNTGQASGVILLVLAKAGVSVDHYTPPQVKSAATGYGAADKSQMRSAVRRLLGLREEPPSDAADALALAFCHATSVPLAGALSDATGLDDARRTRSRYDAAVAAALEADDRADRRTR